MPKRIVPGIPSRIRKYGWIPDRPDFRDLKFADIKPTMVLPAKADLRDSMPPIWDQGDLGSCTAHAIGAAVAYERMKQKETPDFTPSRLFIYYNERAFENTINEDSGAYIRSGIKVVNKLGFCDEKYWPYDVTRFKSKPIASAYKNASLYKVVSYYRMDNTKIDHLKTCLAAGYPFVFGFTVYKSIENSDKTGIIPMPSPTDTEEGGHAVICCGYDDSTKLFLIHNSWSESVGDKGYYYLPYDYVTNPNLSDDFWTIRRTVETDNV